MGIKAMAARKLQEGDRFTPNNIPELVGMTVWDVDVIGATVALTLTDGTTPTSVALPRSWVVEIER